MLLDCRSEEPDAVPLSDSNLVVVVTNSNVKHNLAGSQVRDQSQAGCFQCIPRHAGKKSLERPLEVLGTETGQESVLAACCCCNVV